MEAIKCVMKESEGEYRIKRKDFLSSHALGDFRKCPEFFRKKETGEIEDEDSPAYALGRAAHCLILEGGEVFHQQYFVSEPVNEKTGKAYGRNTLAYQEWLADQKQDVVTPSDFDFIRRLQVAVWLHNEAAKLLQNGIAEGVVRESYCGMPCQIRMDFFNPDRGIIDLKTCDDLTWFEADARRYGYIHQAAFYRAILGNATASIYPVYIIAIEKKQPFRCGVWCISSTALDFAATENAAAIERLKKCRAENAWPTGYEEIRIMENV